MAFDEFDRLHEHPAGAAAGVVDLAPERLDHLGDQLDHALGGIELAATLALGGGELAEKVFVNPAHHILLVVGNGVDVVDGVDQGRQFAGIQPQAGEVVVRQGAAQGRVVLLHRVQGGVDPHRDVILLGRFPDGGPARLLGQVEDVLHGVELHHIDIIPLALGDQLPLALLELVADELEKDEAEHHMLVLGGLHRPPQPVGGFPEGLFEAFGGFLGWLFYGHGLSCVIGIKAVRASVIVRSYAKLI